MSLARAGCAVRVDGVCASGERVWRLLLSMKGLCHVELAETSPNRASHRQFFRIIRKKMIQRNVHNCSRARWARLPPPTWAAKVSVADEICVRHLRRHLRIVPTAVALGTDSKATRIGGERDFSTTLRSAQNDSRRACDLSRCPVRPGVRQCSQRKESPRHARYGRKIRVFPSSIQKHWGFRIQSGGLKMTTLFSASIHAPFQQRNRLLAQ